MEATTKPRQFRVFVIAASALLAGFGMLHGAAAQMPTVLSNPISPEFSAPPLFHVTDLPGFRIPHTNVTAVASADSIAGSSVNQSQLLSADDDLSTQPSLLLPEMTETIEPFRLQHMPDGLLYGSYLAGPRESRIGTAILSNSHGDDVWDTTLGGRVGLLRWGTTDPHKPEGWQLDVEGAAFPRLNAEHNADVDATDFRVGVPLTWRQDRWQFKAAFYHLSSHVGDEFLVRNPSFQRINYSRNAFVLGTGYFPTPDLRLYGEVEYGFFNDGGSEPWAMQFGFDFAPSQPTGLRGAPFLAANAWLREEVDFGGTFTLMTGWAWRSDRNNHLCRLGLQYADGHASQLEFHDQSEQLVGLGLWYDF